MATALVALDNVQDVLAELDDAFYDIPFENSEFQTRAFVIAAQQTPGRAYRSIGLQMFSKIQAVKEHMYQQEKLAIDIEEKEEQLQSPDLNKYEKRRIELELRKLKDGANYAKKLLNDTIVTLNILYSEFKKYPKYTREQFEAEEYNHFNLRLNRQLSNNGASESLLNMTEDLPQFNNRVATAAARIEGKAPPQKKLFSMVY